MRQDGVPDDEPSGEVWHYPEQTGEPAGAEPTIGRASFADVPSDPWADLPAPPPDPDAPPVAPAELVAEGPVAEGPVAEGLGMVEPVEPAEEATQPLPRSAPVPLAPEFLEPVDPPSLDAPPPPRPEPPLRQPDSADIVRDHMRRSKRGPLRRFTLYASGVEQRVLWYAPVEEAEYVVQGSLVILTAIVAAVSGLAASSFLTEGRLVLTPVTVLIGIAWGVLIFFFDRALVSGTFNAYRFTRAEVESLRDSGVETPWAHLVVSEESDRRGVRQRFYEFIRVGLVASLRIALALATSYIAAEMVLFLVFQPEVNARTAYLQQQLQEQRVQAVQNEFSAEAAKRAEERRNLVGGNDPDIARLTTQTDELAQQLETARKDLGILQAAAAAELDGDKYTATLSDGSVVTTTGRRGNGAAARSLAQRRDTQLAIVNDLNTRLTRARTQLDARLAEVKQVNNPALSTLEARENEAAVAQQAAIRAAMDDPSAVNGLLIRQAALEKLTYDQHPETLADDPVPPCTGLFAWFCQLRNWAIPPTPMGPAIVAYRVIFFVIEILPITYKVISSLRRRRPYDVAKAALEEASNIDAIRLLDRHLHDASQEVAGRSHRRHAARPYDTRSRAQPRDWIPTNTPDP